MLYVFHGSDTAQSGNKARALVASLRKKKPDAASVRVDADTWDPSVIDEHLGGQGLFSNKYIVFIDRVTENAEAKEALPGYAAAMQESPNIFIVLEARPNAELKKALEKHAEKIVVSEEKEAAGAFSGKADLNVFALADAVGARDSFKAWMIYRQAIESGIEPENIIGTLFWQAKSMVLAVEAKTVAESGLSPFVYSKAKKYAGNYSKPELDWLLGSLITIYHDGHRGIVDTESSVECLLLNCAKH